MLYQVRLIIYQTYTGMGHGALGIGHGAKYDNYSDPKSFVNFLLPPRCLGEGWGGVKNLQLLQGLL